MLRALIRMHTTTRPRTNMHARTHRPISNTAFPRQKWFANAPFCYVIQTLPVLLILAPDRSNCLHAPVTLRTWGGADGTHWICSVNLKTDVHLPDIETGDLELHTHYRLSIAQWYSDVINMAAEISQFMYVSIYIDNDFYGQNRLSKTHACIYQYIHTPLSITATFFSSIFPL
jgi:hypothetical protein